QFLLGWKEEAVPAASRWSYQRRCQTTLVRPRGGTALSRLNAVSWVLPVCSALRLSQAKTLADLAAAALHVGRVSLAALGRKRAGPAACKHRIKRTWRFCANERVLVSDAMRGLIGRLLKRRAKRGARRRRVKPLLLAFDWTDVRTFHTLMA